MCSHQSRLRKSCVAAKEIARYGEYRTKRLVLDASERLGAVSALR